MAHSALYDEDILLWSERQAEVIRGLGQTRRDLPNDFDVLNVAEEIESVGRSELASVESQLQNILVHLIKLAQQPEAQATKHWLIELVGFLAEMKRRYAPSMRQRIDIDEIWWIARKLTVLERSEEDEASMPEVSPFQLEELLGDDPPMAALAARLTRQLQETRSN